MVEKALVPLIVAVLLLAAGCTAAQVAAVPGSPGLATGSQPPGDGYEQIGAVTGIHVGGCGLYGARGDFEGAHTVLVNKAAQLGAHYVQILKVTPPHLEGICMYQAYIIDGMAYRRVAGSASQVPATPSGASVKTVRRVGTAFAVRPDGFLLTAFHVVKDGKDIEASCPGREKAAASIHKFSEANDLAVPKVAAGTTESYLDLGDPRAIRLGQPVFTIGYPAPDLLGSEAKLTEGIVSSLSVAGDAGYMQISVPVQPGNSGGPLVGHSGEAIGVVIATASALSFLKGTGTLPQNVSWAVKAAFAAPLFNAPEPGRPAESRDAAVERALKATCFITALGEASR